MLSALFHIHTTAPAMEEPQGIFSALAKWAEVCEQEQDPWFPSLEKSSDFL